MRKLSLALLVRFKMEKQMVMHVSENQLCILMSIVYLQQKDLKDVRESAMMLPCKKPCQYKRTDNYQRKLMMYGAMKGNNHSSKKHKTFTVQSIRYTLSKYMQAILNSWLRCWYLKLEVYVEIYTDNSV